MRIGVIGGGLMGVALAYYLADSRRQITLLEQGDSLGGLSGQLAFGDIRVPRYQNPILPTDHTLRDLCAEIGLDGELSFQKAATGFVHERQLHPLANLTDFLSFPVLGMRDRLRLGSLIVRSRGRPSWEALDTVSARDWLIRNGGSEGFERVWRPLLEAKFDGVYDRVAASYIWAWLNRMSAVRRAPQLESSIGYLRRGQFSLIEALAQAFLGRGGRIDYETRVQEIDVTDGRLQRVRTTAGTLDFDLVIATIATPALLPLLPGAGPEFRDRLAGTKYLGMVCPVLLLDAPLSNYWTLNLTDPTFPFATVIETPHPEYAGYSVVHLPRYTAPDNDWLGVSDDVIREAWFSHLKLIFPNFDERTVRHFAVSRSRYAEPVHLMHSLTHRPDVVTPYAGLMLANSSQVYPELPTSNATIAHAQRVAQQITRMTLQKTG